ncbi:DNA polymerase family B-domain-containing protein [Fimicolochytrium jonesii]|uniref:DNA polymerase family B-domain-containing protein n=1 Tax=Fimicolochytrium jonesii TaxID=1396493 RepID=UPI0022FE4B38|nr:DNA polymerase family B-domain-containing protein [Fimicolochytrium jonesii]KAI8823617.1 DNA polymerase family B-domain-containing protein [Fimicolochytrium jonesii]
MVQVTPAKRKEEEAGLVIDRHESLPTTLSRPNPALKKRKSYVTDLLDATPSFEAELEKLSHNAPKIADYKSTWNRPELAGFDPQASPIVFQQIDIDDIVQTYAPRLPNPYGLHEASTLRMFGCTMEGHSVTCHVHGFLPYFYVAAPMNYRPEHKDAMLKALNEGLKINRNSPGQAALDLEMVQRSSIYGYHGPRKALFLRVILRLASFIPAAKRMFTTGFTVNGLGRMVSNPTYESNIPYPLRFMIDAQIQGASWVELPARTYVVRNPSSALTTSQIEIDIFCEDIVAHQPEGEWQKIAPLRILSFDIECAGRKGVFPEASVDPVIQIANMVTLQGESRPFIRNVFTLKKCANIVGTHTLSFETEEELLQAWSDFVVKMDPDMLIGYNINGFDFPYLLERAETLKLEDFPYLGRIKGSRTNAKDSRFSSKGLGSRDTKTINLEGRLQMDVLQVMQRDYKLRSYTLNSVCAHFLGEQKEDVHYSIITDLQNGNDETRRRLAIYCLKDAYLPQRLIDKLMCVINYMEMARVTGVPFNYLLTRGQQIKVVSQLYRKAKTEDLLIPAMEVEGSDDVQYEGATVIEPMKGFYEKPIATLDFTSLYPSIMMAHNLCYSTWLHDAKAADQYGLKKGEDYKVTPDNAFFVNPSVRKGILPTILEDLLAARKRAKNDLKKETDPFKRAVLDGRQLALKISANSVYGFTGATIGKLPLLAISSSVTAYGREMIELTKARVEEKFTLANGYEFDAQVIYGDTDSVMVKFGVDTVADAMKYGREAADYVTSFFEKPINLDFEKVYYPYLLINKKRYAGLYWTKPEKHDKMDTKGIETVRRDSCRLVSSVIETCLKKILVDRDVLAAEEYTKGVISDLLQNKIDLSQLVISKALGKAEYAAKQAHNELAERMRKRDAGSAPALGDRVAYVIIKGTKDAAAYEKAEDPIYVLDNNVPIDTKYYLENQLSKPLMRIFEPILGSKANRLLSGDHTRTISVAAPTIGGLMKFAVKTATCLGCKAVLRKGETAVCAHCKPRVGELYYKHLDAQTEMEVKFARLWTQCQRCQGSLHQDVICTAQDCPIFYMRKKAQKDMGDSAATLARFDYAW